MKKIKWAISFIAVSMGLNVIFTILCFSNFGGFSGWLGSGIVNCIFYIANFPSVLLKIYPFVMSSDNKVVYDMMGWGKPIVLIVNSLAWGLIGLALGQITQRMKGIK